MTLSDLKHIRLVKGDFKVLATKKQIKGSPSSKEAINFTNNYTDYQNCMIATAVKRILGVSKASVCPTTIDVGGMRVKVVGADYDDLIEASEAFLNGAEYFDIQFNGVAYEITE